MVRVAGADLKLVRARAYVRVSHVGKARQDTLLSDAMQLDEARRYAEFSGFLFDDDASRLNADLDVSGFKKPWRQRPGLMRHYEAAKRGEFDALIFYKISRLARNVREALDMIEAFEMLGVSFHFVAERIDGGSAQGRFLRNVLLSAAEMQSEDSSAFLKSACERRAREGRLQGGGVPCWIRRSESGALELIPAMVNAMRRMVALRMSGQGYARIARTLNEEGYRTVSGKYWTQGMTYKYLQEDWLQSMQGIGLFGRGSSDPILISSAYPAILSEEEASRLVALQRLYSQQYGRKKVGGLDWMVSKRRRIGRYSASSIHLLSGILFCPHCGARFVAASTGEGENRSTRHRYCCPRQRTQPDIHPKGLRNVNEISMEDAVLRVVRYALATPPAPVSEAPPVPAPSRVEAIQERIDRLVTMHLDGKLRDEDYARLYAGLLAEREESVSEPDALPEQLKQVGALQDKPDLTREELRQLVLLMVDRVEAPFTLDGVVLRRGSPSPRRLARVRLRFPTATGEKEFLAAIYYPGFRGLRRFIAIDGPSAQDPRTLVNMGRI